MIISNSRKATKRHLAQRQNADLTRFGPPADLADMILRAEHENQPDRV
jgi:hypothetical protein